MPLKKGDRLFVRIDYRLEGSGFTEGDIQDHLAYVGNIAGERYFAGGGFANADGGMALFQAENMEEARKIAENDPLMRRGLYRYEIYEWNLAVVSEDQ